MLHFRDEGGLVQTGFNFYKLSDESSTGFVFKASNYAFRCRYSKIRKTWTIGRIIG